MSHLAPGHIHAPGSTSPTRHLEEDIGDVFAQLTYVRRRLEDITAQVDMAGPIARQVGKLTDTIAEARIGCLDLLRDLDT